MKKLLTALLSLTLFISCSSSDKDNAPKDFREQNEQEIKDYITKNNLEAQRTASGLYYIIKELGTGKQPNASSSVTVAYKGFYTNGKGFDQSDSSGVTFPLSGVIQGWTEGIPLFKEGGNGVLLIPAHLGYGSFDYRGIPGGSVLIFEVKLISVN